MSELRTLLDGLRFGEAPRWHDGALWFSDMHAGDIIRADVSTGDKTVIARVRQLPSGLGWGPDGRLLVVSMLDRRLLKVDDDGSLREVADLSGIATFHCNDMVVDGQGRAYVGNFGFDYLGGAAPAPASMACVEPDGTVSLAAGDLMFPNGAVITPDGSTLIVAETFGARLTAFEIGAAGVLSRRRVWAALGDGAVPDGICLDAQGAVWAASPTTNEVLRLAEGGEVLERIDTGRGAFACMLGGESGQTLFVCTASSSDPAVTDSDRTARIEITEVGTGRAGLP